MAIGGCSARAAGCILHFINTSPHSYGRPTDTLIPRIKAVDETTSLMQIRVELDTGAAL